MRENSEMRHQRLARERATQRYIMALDNGDIDTIIAVLQEAERDAVLEHMLLEVHAVYQAENSIAKEGHIIPMHKQADPGIPAQEQLYRSAQATRRTKRMRWLPQSLVAALIACLIVGSFIVLFAVRNQHGPSSATAGGATPTKGVTSATNSMVVGSTDNGDIDGFRTDSGRVVWRYTTGRQISGFVALVVQDAKAIFATNGHVYALRTDNGTVLWQQTINDQGFNEDKILIENGIAFINVNGGLIYALRVSDGTVLWHYQHGLSAEPLLAVHDGIAYINDTDTNGHELLVAVHAQDGTPIWHYSTPAFTAAVSDGIVYVHSAHVQTPGDMGGNKEKKTLSALRVKDGTLIWRQDVIDNGPGPIFVDHNVVLIGITDHLCGYQTSDGKQLWCEQGNLVPFAANTTTYTIMNSTVYAYYSTGTTMQVEALDVQTGVRHWQWQNPSQTIDGSLVGLNGTVYARSGSIIYALSGSTGQVLWHSQSTTGNFAAIAVG